MLGVIENVAIFQWSALIGGSLFVAIGDARFRRIPNSFTVPFFLCGLLYSSWSGGWVGGLEALGTAMVMALPYLLLFVMGQGGGGDVKMMAAVGAWLQFREGLVVLAAVSIAGGILALARMLTLKQRRGLFSNMVAEFYLLFIFLASGRSGWRLLKSPANGPPLDRDATIPYGVAIFMGVCTGALVTWLQ